MAGTHHIYRQSGELVWRVAKHESSVFDGGTGDAHGNNGGALDPYTIFTVTGDVILHTFWGVVNTNLAGAVSIEVGVAGNTAIILAQQADATVLDDGDVWINSGASVGAGAVGSGAANKSWYFAVNDGADIIESVGGNVTAGQIDYYCIWAPVESGASLVSA